MKRGRGGEGEKERKKEKGYYMALVHCIVGLF